MRWVPLIVLGVLLGQAGCRDGAAPMPLPTPKPADPPVSPAKPTVGALPATVAARA